MEVKSAWGGDGIFLFRGVARLALADGGAYTLDPDPNSPPGMWQAGVARRLATLNGHGDGECRAFYDKL